MATWKERGEVPDSDDDEDSGLESLGGSSPEVQAVNEKRHNDTTRFNKTTAGGKECLEVQSLCGEYESSTAGLPFNNQEDYTTHTDGQNEVAVHKHNGSYEELQQDNELNITDETVPARETHHAVQVTDGAAVPVTPHSSPKSVEDSLFSPLWFENQVQPDLTRLPSLSGSPITSQSLRREEVSRSFVQLNGAVPSSPLESLLSLSNILPRTHTSRSPSIEQQIRPVVETARDVEFFSAPRRNFRQRKQIQLHPYEIEKQKYQRTLKERGIAPIHIANSQEARRRAETAGANESREEDSQTQDQNDSSDDGFIATAASQPMEQLVDQSSPLPLSNMSPSLVGASVSPTDARADSDDEFPDVDVLLRTHSSLPSNKLKRRAKTYTLKSKRSKSFMAFPTEPSALRTVTDTPASPPASSSPPRPANRRVLSRAASAASRASSAIDLPNFHFDDEQDSLPTPVTSSVRRPQAISIESDSDNGVQILDDDDAEEEDDDSGTSSDESVELIRRIAKRVRGVLPASHLRLNAQSRQRSPSVPTIPYATRSASPPSLRRGVALPATRSSTQKGIASRRIGLLENLSNDEDDELNANQIGLGDARSTHGSLMTQSRLGLADEEDSIDPMFPSLKRQRLSSHKSSKRQKTKHTSHQAPDTIARQPRITKHFAGHGEAVERVKYRKSKSMTRKHKSPSRRQHQVNIPRLSILDVIPAQVTETPLFLRLAARTVRQRHDMGRQSPTNKFIRLATREDTADAQSILQDWKAHKIRPLSFQSLAAKPIAAPTRVLSQIAGNRQTTITNPVKDNRAQPTHLSTQQPRRPTRLVVSRRPQQSIQNYVRHENETGNAPRSHGRRLSDRLVANPRRASKVRLNMLSAFRPGQLEANDTTASSLDPEPRFEYTKHILDRLYKASHKRRRPQNNLPLERFLADEDILLRHVEQTKEVDEDTIDPTSVILPKVLTNKGRRRKVQQPRRLDIGAALYRQPTEQFFLGPSSPVETVPQLGKQFKLQGLGKYGSRYPVDFDIHPLPAGVYFHHETYIGSGHLAAALKTSTIPSGRASAATFTLGENEFTWSEWNDTVSAELGICFDLILDRLSASAEEGVETANTKPATILSHVLDYVLNHISFPFAPGLDDFLSRIVKILVEFSGGLVLSSQNRLTTLETLRNICLVSYQALCMARVQPENLHYAFQLEQILQKFSSKYVEALNSSGLNAIRKTYDKVQYLSYREAGLRCDNCLVEHWVSVIRIMATARIPRGSFWDILNSEFKVSEISASHDAVFMEKAWYSMFSLLPLWEFDDYGVVIPGQRFTSSSDNWTLPQQQLKRVFELYTHDQIQSPSFTDYCKALLARCHNLMLIWGWWNCGAVVGTLFDFFASQKLSHLRNEELHSSPRFLKDLHLEPSLQVEPHDRCFHIFLKMVGLGIRHLGEVNNEKAARNLITRLLPNHDRQHLKEEDFPECDVASLRNHHDLLCTLHWAAPIKHKPSLSLIQKLVVVEESHTQAVKINFFTWENILRYVATHRPNMDMINPLAEWHKSSLDALWRQYSNAETDLRRQAEETFAREAVTYTENHLKDIADVNKAVTRPILDMMLQAINHIRNFNMPLNVAKQFFDIRFLAQVLDHRPVQDFSSSLINVLQYYIWLLGRPVEDSYPSEDSQDSFINLDVLNRFEAIQDLASIIVTPLKEHIQALIIDASPTVQSNDSVACWTSLIELLTEEHISGFEFRHFVKDGCHALFDQTKSRLLIQDRFWTAFIDDILSRCCEHPLLVDRFFIPELNIDGEWLRILAQPPLILQRATSVKISVKLHRIRHSLLRLPVSADGVALPETGDEQDMVDIKEVDCRTPQQIMKWALSSMKLIVEGTPGARGSTIVGRQAKEYFSQQLQYLMKSMQGYLQGMEIGSTDHKNYVLYVQEICEDIQVYCSSIRPLDPFFQHNGNHYWPPRSDPHRFAPFAKSFALNLAGENSHKAARSLFYYLQNSFDNTLSRGEFRQHTCNLKKAMGEPTFLQFVVDEMFAPMVEMGFGVRSVPGGWLFCMAYLPVLAGVLREQLVDGTRATRTSQNGNPSAVAYRWTIKSAETLIFYMQLHESSFKHVESGGLQSRYQEILALSSDFWHVVSPGLRKYHSTNAEVETGKFTNLEAAFETVARYVQQIIRGNRLAQPTQQRLFTSTSGFRGVYYEEFRHGLEQYVVENWTLGRGDDNLLLKKSGVRVVFGGIDGKPVTSLGVGGKSVGVRRPDLRRSLIEFEQENLDVRGGGVGRMLMNVV